MPQQRRIPIDLPPKPFLYTIDQVATLISVPMNGIKKHLFYRGVDTGRSPGHLMRAIDISNPEDAFHDWRVEEAELVRWMRKRGVSTYRRKT